MATYEWAGGFRTSGNWSNPANWVTYVYNSTGDLIAVNGVPGVGDIATLAWGGVTFVDTSAGASVAAIDIPGGAQLSLGSDLSFSGAFTLDGLLDLGSSNLTLTGASNNFNGSVWGPGTLLVTGSANVSGLFNEIYLPDSYDSAYGYTGPAPMIEDAGTMTQDGDVSFEVSDYGVFSDGALLVDAGATYTITANSSISGTFTNKGMLTIDAGDTLYFGGGSMNIGGTVNGGGSLEIGEGSSVTVTAPTISSVAAVDLSGGTLNLGLDLSYAGPFTVANNYSEGLLVLNGYTLALTGSSNNLDGAVWGPGTLLVAGSANVSGLTNEFYQVNFSNINNSTYVSGPAPTIEDAGTMTQDGNLSFYVGYGYSDGTLLIDAGATYTLTAAVSAGGIITNNGTFVDADASDGTSYISGTFTNNGLLSATAGTLDVNADVTGAGSALVTGGANLTFSEYFQQNVTFSGAGALVFSHVYGGTVTNFLAGDTISLQRSSGDTFGYTVSGDTATLTISDSIGATVDSFTAVDTQGAYAATGAFTFAEDSNGVDTITSQQTICFMAGTLIQTPDGEVAIETLKRGDPVLTFAGEVKPVVWLGRQTVSIRFADPLRSWPIRVKAGALAENVPSRDLLASPDHALLVGDVLIHAGALVNGTSVVRETLLPPIFVYYHVELEDHTLILAENTPAETFVDNVDRLAFDNWSEHEALYPEGKLIAEMTFPRAKARRQVPMRIRAALDERAKMICVDEFIEAVLA